MKKFLSWIGGIFLILILVGAAFFGYAAYQGQALDKSSKAYVEANLPVLISTWSRDEFTKRSSPQLLKIFNENPEQLDFLLQKFSKLGRMHSIDEIIGDSNMSYTTQHGKTITASYKCKAKFENGDADIALRIIQISGQWQLLSFNVNSPLLLQ